MTECGSLSPSFGGLSSHGRTTNRFGGLMFIMPPTTQVLPSKASRIQLSWGGISPIFHHFSLVLFSIIIILCFPFRNRKPTHEWTTRPDESRAGQHLILVWVGASASVHREEEDDTRNVIAFSFPFLLLHPPPLLSRCISIMNLFSGSAFTSYLATFTQPLYYYYYGMLSWAFIPINPVPARVYPVKSVGIIINITHSRSSLEIPQTNVAFMLYT